MKQNIENLSLNLKNNKKILNLPFLQTFSGKISKL